MSSSACSGNPENCSFCGTTPVNCAKDAVSGCSANPQSCTVCKGNGCVAFECTGNPQSCKTCSGHFDKCRKNEVTAQAVEGIERAGAPSA